ncbi:unnamed protein product [Oppiella nova]|uniref:Uncharacterized protein n=1 Tax=Oppiella nova TaxID=334625 RepID=A0A7R9LD49_9ACAR|nr:unnamed protein product [Oppiella nova]CAG2162365.1 unnamed protein product [Oppiella nova]
MNLYIIFIVTFLNFYVNGELTNRLTMVRGRPNGMFGMVRPPVPDPDEVLKEIKPQYYDQRLNHLDAKDNRTFKQIYYTDDSHYKSGGPVFVYIEGEANASPEWITSSASYVVQSAKQFNAFLVLLEHRYYGESQPFNDTTVEHLKYLSSEQALADTAEILQYLTKKLSLSGKVVVFGGSYAGSLAAWFREKYPNIAVGAIASSAPVLAEVEKYPNIAVGAIASSAPVLAEVDFKEYFGVVSDSLGTECSQNIREATQALDELLTTPEGVKKVRQMLNLCDTFNGTDSLDVAYLTFTLSVTIGAAVQHNAGIDGICRTMNDSSVGTPLQRYAKVNGLPGYNCSDIKFTDMVKSLDHTIKIGVGARQWFYQMCTEFGYFWTTNVKDCIFGHNVPVHFYNQICNDVFGSQITPQTIQKAVDTTNTYYGGRQPNVTNVVFPNGSLDPYHALGVLHDLNNSTKAVMISGQAHGADMIYSANETQSLRDAHNLITNELQEFLK